MTLPTYNFTFPVEAAGLSLSIKDAADSEVATATLGSTPDESGVLSHQVTLDSGNYVGTVELATAGIPNASPASWRIFPDRIESTGIAAGGGVGASETAKFIGTTTGDTSGNEFDLTFVADGDLPAGYSVNGDGDIEITGPVSISMVYRFNGQLDFTDATGFTTDYSPDADVTIKCSRYDGDGFGVNAGGPYAFVLAGASGTVFNLDAVEEGITQSTRAAGNERVILHGTVNANGYDAYHQQVADGVLSAAVAVWVTRNALPDLPPLPA